MIIMVTGSREWKREGLALNVLKRYEPYEPITLLHGAAAGLDNAAARLARGLGWEVIAFPPDKKLPSPERYHTRNKAMLDWLPDVVLAFRRLDAENRGTDSVIREARRRHLQVVVTEYDGSVPFDGITESELTVRKLSSGGQS